MNSQRPPTPVGWSDTDWIEYLATPEKKHYYDLTEAIEIIEKLKAKLAAHDQDWSRFHHLMKKHGLHPGRTDDDLIDILDEKIEELHRDAERYRDVRRGQKWSVIDGIGDTLRADDLDAAIDAAMKKPVVDAEKASKPRYVLRTCEECWGDGESEKYGYDDYSCGFCHDCMGTGKVAILKEST